MQIHIITFTTKIGVVVRAYFDYDKAKMDYDKLVEDKNASGSYGLVSVPIQDTFTVSGQKAIVLKHTIKIY